MVNDEYAFVFMHNPKTAGTSIEGAIRQIPGTWCTAGMNQIKREKYVARYYADNPAFFLFVFVRNPWDRFVSVYRHSMRKRRKKERMEFSTYVEQLHQFFTCGINSPNLKRFDKRHARPQHLFVPNGIEPYFGVRLGRFQDHTVKVLRFENLEDEFYNSMLPSICSREDQEWISLDHFTWGSDPVDYKDFYTSSNLIDAVGSIYDKDINLFNYKFDDGVLHHY